MAKIGYVMVSPHYDNLEQDRKWMTDFGCIEIITEDARYEKQRPMFRELLDRLEIGDVLVVPKLSNAVRSLGGLSSLLEFCRTRCVRLIAYKDKIDSADEVFPAVRTSDLLNILAVMPDEMTAMRNQAAHVNKIKKLNKTSPGKAMEKMERDQTIVNLYLSGLPIDKIMQASGFKARSSVYRILDMYNIEYNRGYSKQEKSQKRKDADVKQ